MMEQMEGHGAAVCRRAGKERLRRGERWWQWRRCGVCRVVAKRRIIVVHVGRHVRIPRSAVQAFIEEVPVHIVARAMSALLAFESTSSSRYSSTPGSAVVIAVSPQSRFAAEPEGAGQLVRPRPARWGGRGLTGWAWYRWSGAPENEHDIAVRACRHLRWRLQGADLTRGAAAARSSVVGADPITSSWSIGEPVNCGGGTGEVTGPPVLRLLPFVRG
jgi:hypothetical protein